MGQLKDLGFLLCSAVSERICLLSTWSVNERPSLFCLCSLNSLVAEFTITSAKIKLGISWTLEQSIAKSFASTASLNVCSTCFLMISLSFHTQTLALLQQILYQLSHQGSHETKYNLEQTLEHCASQHPTREADPVGDNIQDTYHKEGFPGGTSGKEPHLPK